MTVPTAVRFVSIPYICRNIRDTAAFGAISYRIVREQG